MCGRDGETLTNAVLWELERVVCKRSCNPARLAREANDRPGLISEWWLTAPFFTWKVFQYRSGELEQISPGILAIPGSCQRQRLDPGDHLGCAMPWAPRQLTARSPGPPTWLLTTHPWFTEGVYRQQTRTNSTTRQLSTFGRGVGRDIIEAAAGGELTDGRGRLELLVPSAN